MDKNKDNKENIKDLNNPLPLEKEEYDFIPINIIRSPFSSYSKAVSEIKEVDNSFKTKNCSFASSIKTNKIKENDSESFKRLRNLTYKERVKSVEKELKKISMQWVKIFFYFCVKIIINYPINLFNFLC